MHVQDDYLLRIIRRIAAALGAMLRGESGAEETFDEASMEGLGLTTKMMEVMPVDRVLTTIRRARMSEGVAIAMVGLRLKVAANAATGIVQQERLRRALEFLEMAVALQAKVDGVDIAEQARDLRARLTAQVPT